MTALEDLKAFDIAAAELSLWVFKKRSPAAQNPIYSGRWVETTTQLDSTIKQTVAAERTSIEESEEYSLLAQPNEGSVLSITAVETHAGLLTEQATAETPERKVTRVKQLQNVPFYAIKLVTPGKTLFAISKSGASWKTRKDTAVFFSDEQLDLDTRETFEILKTIDFFIISDIVLVRRKGAFESTLSYKQAHVEDFGKLQSEPEFLKVFVDLKALVEHVGANKIHLRRISAIRSKGHYKNPVFMDNLRKYASHYGFHFEFDKAGKLIMTKETCHEVIIALLDHRLASGFSNSIYDVPNTTQIST